MWGHASRGFEPHGTRCWPGLSRLEKVLHGDSFGREHPDYGYPRAGTIWQSDPAASSEAFEIRGAIVAARLLTMEKIPPPRLERILPRKPHNSPTQRPKKRHRRSAVGIAGKRFHSLSRAGTKEKCGLIQPGQRKTAHSASSFHCPPLGPQSHCCPLARGSSYWSSSGPVAPLLKMF